MIDLKKKLPLSIVKKFIGAKFSSKHKYGKIKSIWSWSLVVGSSFSEETYLTMKKLKRIVVELLSLQLSQAATCDGLIYTTNYDGQNSGTQGCALPLFEN